MYSTCLFCNSALGANEAIEPFPVGRRLAFDAAKGRLWVVCRQCERWNLTPLEERWEAIEACERAFRETRLRVSTDEIGMARLREGLELVRIGAPQRPEMAAWRYGDQFGRRRRRALVLGGAVGTAVAGYLIAGPVMGVVATVGLGGTGVLNLMSAARTFYRARAVAARIPVADGQHLVVQRDQVDHATLLWDPRSDRWTLDVTHRRHRSAAPARPIARPVAVPWWKYDPDRSESTFAGDEAIRAARMLLPAVNASGAGRRTVTQAVDFLETAPEPGSLFARAAQRFTKREAYADVQQKIRLAAIPAHVRLALEMSAHEETERRALEGELHLLESAWQDAEEIAAIADDMFLPASVNEELKRLQERRSGRPT